MKISAASAWPQPFHTTHWSVVTRARGTDEAASRAAMEQLCRTYWQPLYGFVRRKGHAHADACDLTQGFFERLIARSYLTGVDAARGRFRSWLLTAISHFLLNEYDRSQRLRRGGGVSLISLEELEEAGVALQPGEPHTPETLYERQWVEALLKRVLERLKQECLDHGHPRHFEALKPHLIGSRGETPLAETAAALRMSEAGAKSAVHRFRQRYGRLFHEEVSHTLGHPDDLQEEIRHLLHVMSEAS
jgi:RNA polymerase sigma factor (sigma-70 family)